MADDKGILIASNIIPAFDDGVVRSHATHIAKYGKGGWREVATITERDAITSERREAGMAVYVTSEKKLYILNSDLITWSLFSAGGVVVMPTPSETELGNIVQYIGETTQDYTQGYFYKCVSDGEDPATYSWVRINVQPETDLVWGNITGVLSDQTDLNTQLVGLQDQINSLSGRGKFLSTWDCTTGLPTSTPLTESPYIYKTGDYYIVSAVSSSTPAVNYRPDGTEYIFDPEPVPSAVVETEEVSVNDTYIFDGNEWRLLSNAQKEITFASIAGDPYDNTNLSNAFDEKVTITNTGSQVYGTDDQGEQTTYSIDTTVTEDSDNLITSGGVFTAISEAQPIYTAEEPSTVEVGGFPINSQPVNMTFAEFADKLLHKYVAPTNSLVINPSTSPLQLGTILDVTGTSTVTRKATSDYPLTKLVFYSNGVVKETITDNIDVKTGTFSYVYTGVGTTSNTKYFKQTLRSTLTDLYGSNVSSEKSIEFVAPTFYGKVAIPAEYDDTPAHVKTYLQTNIESIISNLTKQTTVSSTIDNACTLTKEHYIFVTPFTWTGTKKIYDVITNMDYTNSTSTFTHNHTEKGVTTTYNVYYLTDYTGSGNSFTFRLTVTVRE